MLPLDRNPYNCGKLDYPTVNATIPVDLEKVVSPKLRESDDIVL